jgi:hypothetical protein
MVRILLERGRAPRRYHARPERAMMHPSIILMTYLQFLLDLEASRIFIHRCFAKA